MALTTIEPTTTAGAVALLTYFADVEGLNEQIWPEDVEEASDASVSKEGASFAYFLARNLARALDKMTTGEKAVQS